MASNEAVYGLKLAWRSITGFAAFGGRSRRTELFYYWLAAGMVSLLLSLVEDPLLARFADTLSWREQRLLSEGAKLLVVIPFFALFVRRLHDQDRTGWWVLILPPLLAMNIYKALRFILLDPQTNAVTLPDLPGALMLAGVPLALASVVLMLLPGTNGTNRFGSDPRDQDRRAVRLSSAPAGLSSSP